MTVPLSQFTRGLKTETAFDVLAVAQQLKAGGKDVVQLQIGDSPFASTAEAKRAGIRAIQTDQTHYCPSVGLSAFRQVIAEHVNRQHNLSLTEANIVVGPGAKVFEQFFCEAVVNPGDQVLIFSPHFPTYVPNIERRGGQVVFSQLRADHAFRPSMDDVRQFVQQPRARAIFLNSPHNPTGGVAEEQDIEELVRIIRGKPIGLFSDEPYDQMVWRGRHHSPIAHDILDQCVAAYTFSKSFSMSGWRVGYAVSSPRLATAIATMINTALSCVPPIVQCAALEALKHDEAESQANMKRFANKVRLLSDALRRVEGVQVVEPAGTFYVFPQVAQICNRLKIRSHGLAMYLLEAADDAFGVACLGGECFGAAGSGFLRFSCAEPDDRLLEAIEFLPDAFSRQDRIDRYLKAHSEYRLPSPYPVVAAPAPTV